MDLIPPIPISLPITTPTPPTTASSPPTTTPTPPITTPTPLTTASSPPTTTPSPPTITPTPLTAPSLSTPHMVFLVITITGGQFVNIVAGVSLNMALPSIGRELNIPQQDLQWLISAYSLTFGCFLLLAGKLADIFGRRMVFLIGSVWFALWTLVCGFSPNGISLDLFRALQGLGAAATVPAGIGILGVSFHPGPTKNKAFAAFSSGSPLGGAIGLILGGVCTEALGWRWVFYITAIISLLVIISGWFTIPQDVIPEDVDRNIDWIGALLSVCGLVLFTFCLAQGSVSSEGWATPYIIALLILSVILMMLFLVWEGYIEKRVKHGISDKDDDFLSIISFGVRHPLMPLSVWRTGKFAAVNAIAFFGWASFLSYQFYATLYYQYYLNYSPINATLKFIPTVISGTLTNIVAAYILGLVSSQLLVIIGLISTSVASLLFALIDPSLTYWAMAFPAMTIVVLGADLMFNVCNMYITSAVSQSEQALAGGIFNTVTQIGTALGLAVSTIVATSVTGTSTEPSDILRGYRAAYWMAFALGMVGVLIACTLCGIGKVGAVKKSVIATDSGESDQKKDILQDVTVDIGELEKFAKGPPEIGDEPEQK